MLLRRSDCRLMVGFNRRFAPLVQQAKHVFKGVSEPLIVNYRINAGFMPKDHWTQTVEGGGRIVGEVCHFIDLLQFLTESEPRKVYAECITSANSQITNHD